MRICGAVLVLMGLFMIFMSLASRPTEVGDVIVGMIAVVMLGLGALTILWGSE